MPTYSYRCTECDNAFDVQQSFTDSSLTVCPRCGGILRKVFSPIGVSFTGSGFYRNDSRATPPGKKGATESSGSDSSSPAKTPDKPVTAATTAAATSTPGTKSGTGKTTNSSAAT
ncbi:MAG: FmdB family zinc ribbon protein [Terrimesophilobacter sp.]